MNEKSPSLQIFIFEWNSCSYKSVLKYYRQFYSKGITLGVVNIFKWVIIVGLRFAHSSPVNLKTTPFILAIVQLKIENVHLHSSDQSLILMFLFSVINFLTTKILEYC